MLCLILMMLSFTAAMAPSIVSLAPAHRAASLMLGLRMILVTEPERPGTAVIVPKLKRSGGFQ